MDRLGNVWDTLFIHPKRGCIDADRSFIYPDLFITYLDRLDNVSQLINNCFVGIDNVDGCFLNAPIRVM